MKISTNLIAASLIIAGAAMVNSGAAQAACTVSNSWRINHSNNAVAVFSMDQNGSRLFGSGYEARNGGTLRNGRIAGREVTFQIRWSNGRSGEYSGRIDSNGRVSGINNEIGRPTHHSVFHIPRAFRCA